jgi:RNA-directed DNA polymerase
MSKLTWNNINWTLVQDRISRHQRRVYKASREGNKAKVHAIQRRIIASLDAKLLAVRKVTTETKISKAISHENKIKLAYQIRIDGKPRPIPKPGKGEICLLAIATIEERANQMLAKLALEPEWEALFEPNSYGFRPGRSSHDAIARVFFSLRRKSQYVLSADITKCFDRIDHEKLILKLSTFDRMKNQIKTWLKADIMLSGVLSSFLSNIVLHGLGDYIKEWYAKNWYPTTGRNFNLANREIGFSRYSDNFIITAPERKDIEAIEKQVTIWLEKEAGLELSKAKIKIIHSTESFEFLGFQIISIKPQTNEDYKVKIHPSKRSKASIIQGIRKLIQENKSTSSYSLIQILSSRIIGWANYFRHSECIEDFTKLDYTIFNQIRAWVFRRKSKGLKSRTKLKQKYFPDGKKYFFRGKTYQNNWILNGKAGIKDWKREENFLPKMVWVSSTESLKINPSDGNHLYWAERTEKYSGFSKRISKLIRIQEGV